MINIKNWPENIKVNQVRIARPTNKLIEIKRFYGDGIGLPVIGSFEDHDGYSGLMFGLPDSNYHLEFTQHTEEKECRAPTKDNLLVFYLPDKNDVEKIASRLNSLGYKETSSQNPYWNKYGVTIEDPDGWRIVLMNTGGINSN